MCFIEVFGGDVAGCGPDEAFLPAGGGQVGVKERVRDALPAAVRADGEMPVVDQLFADDGDAIRWRSPVAMPRWASRITLEIADVGVERAAGEWGWVVTVRRLGAEEVEP